MNRAKVMVSRASCRRWAGQGFRTDQIVAGFVHPGETMATRYPIGQNVAQVTTLLQISPERVLRRAGLSASLVSNEDLAVSAEMFFRIWEAVRLEANRPDLELQLAMTYAHGPFLPPIFAFSCADTLELGLRRLADFKPLIGPISLEIKRSDHQVRVELRPVDPSLSMPTSLGLFELLYMTECARTFTGTHVMPVETSLPSPTPIERACVDFLGKMPAFTDTVSLTFSADDADLPLVTRSASLWQALEPKFLEELENRLGRATMSSRIKKALVEALPGGATSVDDMARRLHVSKRSLQRRLSEEGTSFQALLNETRFQMSERYLRDSSLSIPEISYLLGFRDTSSFFRAFHGWTGSTPGDFRSMDTKPTESRLH